MQLLLQVTFVFSKNSIVIKSMAVLKTNFIMVLMLLNASASLAQKTTIPYASSIKAALPLSLSGIRYNVAGATHSQKVADKISTLVADFYNEYTDDELRKYVSIRDVYFNTLCISYHDVQLYVLLLKMPVGSNVHCRLFVYDPVRKACSQGCVRYNKWAEYSVAGNKLIASDIKRAFKKYGADITQRNNELILTRINHNGTFNAIEEIACRLNGTELDSVAFRSTAIH